MSNNESKFALRFVPGVKTLIRQKVRQRHDRTWSIYSMRLGNIRLSPLLLALCVSCSTATVNYEADISALSTESLENAGLLYKMGEFDRAKNIYKKYYDNNTKKPEVLERLGNITLFENKPHEAEKYFLQALENSSIKFWPFSANLKVRLALTYLRMDNYAEAVKYFEEAAGPLPMGPFKQISALAHQFEMFAADSAYIVDGPEQSHIKFVTRDPLPVVEISINHSSPVKFFIDTGAMDVVVDSAFAAELGLQISSRMVGDFAGSKKSLQGLGKAASIEVGAMTIKNVPISTVDISGPVTPIFNRSDIKGILGTRFLMHFVSTLDYINGEMVLTKISGKEPSENNIAVQQSTGEFISIPFWLVDTHYIMAKGSVNGIGPMLFWVDTGLAGKGFTAPQPLLNKAGIEVDWSKSRKTSGGGGEIEVVDINVESLSLGEAPNEVTQTNVPGLAVKNDTTVLNGVLGFKVGGVISHQFFRDYSITFDFQQMQLQLRRS